MIRTTLIGALLAGASLIAMAQVADAATLWALDSTGSLTRIDTETKKATAPVAIKGAEGPVMAIAVRPADGKLYGLTAMGIVAIDPMTGMAKPVSKFDKPVETGPRAAAKFNPTVDRLRVVGMNGHNYRINVDTGAVTVDGALKYAPGTPQAGTTPMVTAAAYTNAMAGAKETALYTFDTTLGSYNIQMPPNDGVQMMKGPIEGKLPYGLGFDILSDGAGGNTGYLVTNGALHRVNLADGKIMADGPITGLAGREVLSIAATK
jgi:hypothetical protein